MAERYPIIGGDIDTWAEILLGLMRVSINEDGSLKIESNVMLNAMRIAILGDYSILDMADGFVDMFKDESGIDTASSLYEVYDGANDWYTADFTPPTAVMQLISESVASITQPDLGRVHVYYTEVDSITINTDLKAYVSRDGGTTWSEATLTAELGENLVSGSADLSSQPAGTSMRYKIELHNTKQCKINGVGLTWD